MTKNKCLLCGATEFAELLHIERFPIFFGAIPIEKRNQVESFPLTIVICEFCSLIQQVNLLEQDVLRRIYTEDYYNCPSPLASGMGTIEIDKFYTFFMSCKLKKGKLLEIGCFDGYLLNKLHDSGWDVHGCDPSAMTERAVEHFGKEKIINDFFEDDTFPPESFDIIILRNLLEHLYNIHDFLQSVIKCLKPGGKIFIDVPNIRTLVQYGSIGTFFHQHISYFSLHTLSTLLGMHEFSIANSYEGNPNLFIAGVKERDISIVDYSSNNSFNIKKEKDFFLEATRKVEKKIMSIFDNSTYQNIAIFGASIIATRIINLLKKKLVNKIKYIFDNDALKYGKVIYGCDVPISDPSKLDDSKFDVILISTYLFEKEIYDQLVELGVAKNKIMTLR